MTVQRLPVVSVTTVYPYGNLFGRERAMGFITDVFPNGIRLIATCWHSHGHLWRNKSAKIAIVPTETRAKPFVVIGKPIINTTSERDVLFILAKDPEDAPVQLFDLTRGDPPMEGLLQLYNSRNLSEVGGTPRFLAELTVQTGVKELMSTAFTKRTQFRECNIVHWVDTSDIERFSSQGWVPNRIFNMQSRPGYSGSPVWDDEHVLYGMDLRGTSGGVADELVCLPTSELYRERQAIEPRLQKQLGAL